MKTPVQTVKIPLPYNGPGFPCSIRWIRRDARLLQQPGVVILAISPARVGQQQPALKWQSPLLRMGACYRHGHPGGLPTRGTMRPHPITANLVDRASPVSVAPPICALLMRGVKERGRSRRKNRLPCIMPVSGRTIMPRKTKKATGRPVRGYPPRIDATPEQIANRVLTGGRPTTPSGRRTYRCADCRDSVRYPDTLHKDGRCSKCHKKARR